MAKNLQAKLPPADNVSLFDINRDVIQRLAGEMKASQAGGASVVLASSAADASKHAVRSFSLSECFFHLARPPYNDDFILFYL
jgi:hypothetical protein